MAEAQPRIGSGRASHRLAAILLWAFICALNAHSMWVS